MKKKIFTSFRRSHFNKIFSGLGFLFAIIFLAVFLRFFLFEIYSIPSGSMEETLVPGDRIVVSKVAYGAALPRSPLEVPWFNAFFLLHRQAIAANDTFVWHYRRLPGLKNLRSSDVVVFRYPPDPHQTYIKRCVALPGDTVRVNEGVLYVNWTTTTVPRHMQERLSGMVPAASSLHAKDRQPAYFCILHPEQE